MLDAYISFFRENESSIQQYAQSIVFIFFGWEPLLVTDSIKHFIEQTRTLDILTKFVIYTNGLLIDESLLQYLTQIPNHRDRAIFYISIDGDFDSGMQSRTKTRKQFDTLIWNIELLKRYNLNFSFSKVIAEKDAETLAKNLRFLDTFKPEKLSFLPVSYHHEHGYSDTHIKEVIRWIDMFIRELLSQGYSELQIMEYFWLPDTLPDYKNLYKADIGLYGHVDGNIYGIIDALPIFSLGKTLTEEEQSIIKIWSIDNPASLIETITNYENFEGQMIEAWKKWHERISPNEVNQFWLLGMYFIKKLLLMKYKPQDAYVPHK